LLAAHQLGVAIKAAVGMLEEIALTVAEGEASTEG
jgi:hypothetical protein